MKRKLSTRTLALLVAAGLLFSIGTVTGVRAYPNIQSELYRAHFYLNHLQVHLLENDKDVCGGKNTLDGTAKITGPLATNLGYKSLDEVGSVEPGKIYDEKIQAENGQDISQFVRMTVRKYWVETENGKVKVDSNGEPVKTTALKPSLIHLTYGTDDYNTGAWAEVTQERTTESRTYIYKKLLPGNKKTDPIFTKLQIDESVAVREDDPIISTEGDTTIYTYVYKYDGYAFFIEADVQAIQAHNAQDAIESQWGPYVKATYTENSDGSESGSLSVK